MIRPLKITALLLFSASIVVAQEVRTDPTNYWVQTKTWEEPLSSTQLIESSLTASGLTGENLDHYINKYNQLIGNFKNDLNSSSNNLSFYNKGEYILNWAYKNILNHYIEKQTSMDKLLDTGNYNCVSSAVFYLILSKEAGIETKTIETSDHAFCTVKTEKGWIDVETTTVFGFDPGIKKEFQKSFNQTGYSYVPPGNYHNRKQIGDKETVALILQNRMSALQKQNNHSEAVGIAIDRWILWENKTSQKDMNDAFRNWAAVLNNNGNYIDAFNFLKEVSEKYKLKDINRDLLYSLSYNELIEFTKNKNFPEAEYFLNSSSKALPEQDLKKLKQILVQEQVSETVKNGSYEQSLPLVRQAYSSSGITRSVWKNWITVLHQNKAHEIAQSSGWWDAWQFLKDLPQEEKTLSGIVSSTNTAHDNWSFEVHNKFADLFNSKNTVHAEQVLLQALKKDPNNKYLLKDLSILKKMKP